MKYYFKCIIIHGIEWSYFLLMKEMHNLQKSCLLLSFLVYCKGTQRTSDEAEIIEGISQTIKHKFE